MTGLSPDIQAMMLALLVGIVAGFASGGVVLALRIIRSPRRGF